MAEALNEVYLGENNLEKMRKASKGAAQTLKMKDGNLKMDSFTASAIMQIYDKINDKNKKTFEKMMKDGKRADILKLQKFAMSKISSEYVPEAINYLDELNFQVKDGVVYMTKAEYEKANPEAKSTQGENPTLSIYMNDDDEEPTDMPVKFVKEAKLAADPTLAADPALGSEPKLSAEPTLTSSKKKILAKGMGKEVVNDNGAIKLMKGGKVISTGDYDRGADGFFMNVKGKKGQQFFDQPEDILKIKEELDEAKYDLYHKDFSSAMQHSYAMAKKLYGITIDPKEIDDKVATGPKKPGQYRQNKYRLKGDKGAIQVQVYNKGG